MCRWVSGLVKRWNNGPTDGRCIDAKAEGWENDGWMNRRMDSVIVCLMFS
jgi:hypothetical protein